jgi:predicted aspartyl protease
MNAAQAALKESPRDAEIHHTVGSIFERMRRYEQAAAAYTNYINLLPNKDRSEKAAWSRSQVRFLKSFGEREPIAIADEVAGQLHTVDFRLVDDKVIVKARVNNQKLQDFVLDTGSEQTTISRQTASSTGVRPITYTLSAGVGEVGLRGLQLGRADSLEIGTLKLSNIPVMIKAPALRGLPKRETESFSPLSLGMSMIIDYGTRKLTMGRNLPEESAGIRLPMRHHRLSLVKGLINEQHPTYFVVDTGGEVISISTATAEAINAQPARKIALRVYGTSGWDRDAFLLPGQRLRFAEAIEYRNFSFVVLNLRAPSVLLGFEVGGIVGHKFLSPYRVALDMARSELRMSPPELAPAGCEPRSSAPASRLRASSSGVSSRSGGTAWGLPSPSIETNVRNARLVGRRRPVRISSENTSTSTSRDVWKVAVTRALRMTMSPTRIGCTNSRPSTAAVSASVFV